MNSCRVIPVTAVLAGMLALVGCGGPGASVPTGGEYGAGRLTEDGSRVVLIMLENHGFEQVIGNPKAPYLNRLARRQALATNYHAITHPSLPNYLALLAGSDFGIHSDCTDCEVDARSNLATQLSDAGLSWRGYMEDLPDACSDVSYSDGYAKKHDPFMYFPSITQSPEECAKVVPGRQLQSDLDAGRLPAFSWISPDLCHDGHDCGMEGADRYLNDVVPDLLKHLGPQGFLVIAFDEDGTDGDRGDQTGGRIAVVLAGPTVMRGARLATPYDHYSLLRTFEAVFGLPPLRNASSAQPMRDAFNTFPELR